MGSSYSIFLWTFLLISFKFLISPSLAVKNHHFTLYGDAFITKNSSISLTKESLSVSSSSSSSSSLTSGLGRALFAHPIRFLDPSTNSTASFECRFTFTIISTPHSPSAEGLAFLITSNASSVSRSSGYMGLPNHTMATKDSFLAVEFDTSFNSYLGDIDDNHVGIDINSAISRASATAIGIDLNSGNHITAWITYAHKEKMLTVWINNLPFKPRDPLLSIHIDLSKQILEEYMYVGFSASNGRLGSSRHILEGCRFRRFDFNTTDMSAEENHHGIQFRQSEHQKRKATKLIEIGSYLAYPLALVGFTILLLVFLRALVMLFIYISWKLVEWICF